MSVVLVALGKPITLATTSRKSIHETNHLYVAPSNQLAEQTAGDLRKRGLSNVVVVNSDSHPRNVRRQIIKEMKGAPEDGLVLVVTWQAYVGLPYVPRRRISNSLSTKFPQLDRFFQFVCCPRMWSKSRNGSISPALKNEQVGVVKARDLDKLQRYLEDDNDDVKDAVIAILRDVASPNKNCVCGPQVLESSD